MDMISAAVLGFVEGLTEFLPVSSTGHLILASRWLGLAESEAEKAFSVVIQGGAILAVVWNYRELLWRKTRPLLRRDRAAWRFWFLLLAAFLPAAVIGLALHQKIKAHLFGVEPVLAALLIGGVLMIVVERLVKRRPPRELDDWSELSFGKAVGVGFFQCLAMWPGTSRSMSTILGARLLGLTNVQAAEFSFLLAIPTLLAATVFDLYKSWSEFAALNMWGPLVVGFLTSYVVALVVIRVFLGFLRHYGLEPFGWYRIALALVLYYFW